MSLSDRMPPEAPLGCSLGLKLYALLTFDGCCEATLQTRYRLLNEMLSSNPLSVFNIIPDATTGAGALHCSVVVGDDLRFALAGAANDLEAGHDSPLLWRMCAEPISESTACGTCQSDGEPSPA